jgi:hypothetical protein
MSMKFSRFILIAVLFIAVFPTSAQDNRDYDFKEATELTIIGKLMDTPQPYDRVDTIKYKGWDEWENFELRTTTGIAVVFKTDSRNIVINPVYGRTYLTPNAGGYAYKGFDLYIKKDGEWLWAAANGPGEGSEGKQIRLISNMDGSMHECLMYFPVYSEMKSVKIGVDKGSVLEPIPSPFRHRIAIYGSSFTHGVSCGRAGMTYPAIFTRRTGIQLLSMAMSGRCKMQPYAAEVLKDADVEGYIFDTYSNPSPQEIRERLFPFIEKLQSTHPDVPLIFQRTIRRENRNFNTNSDAYESERIHVADSMMNIACKKYKNVYYIHPNATSDDHEATIDGVHPSNYGYTLWERSIEKKVLKILRKYGIK